MSTNQITRLSQRGAIAAFCLLAVMSLPAQAATEENGEGWVTTQVSTSRLNLASTADESALRHRVAVAALHVCQNVLNGEAGDAAFQECYATARRAAWMQAEGQIAAARGSAVMASARP